MELGNFISLFHGWFFLIIIFASFLGYVMFKGRQNLVNLMMGMYLALLLYKQFPYFEILTPEAGGDKTIAIVHLVVFGAFTVLATWLFSRLMPREYLEGAFETMGRKILLAVIATILFFGLATYFIPLNEVINTGAPLPEFLLSDNYHFLWLTVPLVVLFLI